MFNFFTKKNYLVDYLDGFVDIHNHILPGLDDGAKTVEDSISLLKGMGEFGITNFICTPHIMDNYYPNDIDTIKSSYKKLEKSLPENSLDDVKIDFAAEHMIDSNFENLLDLNQIIPLAKSYILVEMSYLQASINFESSLEKIKEKGLFPILAHPERYVFLHTYFNKYNVIKNKGILFQLNLLSLSDYYGKEVKKIALKLLDKGLIDFVASDVHNLQQINHLKEIKLNKHELDSIEPLIEKTKYNFS
ncbi:tyrosine-protein phosphatase [Maribacter sp. 2210JD10-5]|uniref:tyrosine-protein phosphatase n=1 Tax=Maribacter sp. 2210JD10-5 TaxID=3386272 RepID=UPI0039BC618F